jgi:nucleoside-diphosphate-sugar epimerase
VPPAVRYRVAVVGSSGFVGRHVVPELQGRGFDVVPLTRRSSAVGLSRGMAVDFSDEQSLAKALVGVTAVVHVAGLAHVAILDASHAARAYRAANEDLVAMVARASARARVAKFVLLSSAGVMGQQSPAGGFTVNASPAPYDEYTLSKFAGETRLSDTVARTSMTAVVLRPPMIYGPDAPGTFRRIRDWLRTGRPLPLGGVNTRRSAIGIRNLCDAIGASLHMSSEGMHSALVCDEETLSVGQFCVEMAAHVPGARVWRVSPRLLEVALRAAGRSADYRRLFGDFEINSASARDLLRWSPRYSAKDEIAFAMQSR